MKGFKYKLDGLLKLRKFEEDKVKFELGQVNAEIQRCDEEMNYKENLHLQQENVLRKLQEAHQKFKILSNMKEKDQVKFNKSYMKKLEQDIEEVNRLKKKEGCQV